MRDCTPPYPHWSTVPFENPQYWTLYHLRMTAAQWQPPGSNIIQHPRLRSAAETQLYQVCHLCQPVPVPVPSLPVPTALSWYQYQCKYRLFQCLLFSFSEKYILSPTQPTFSCGRNQKIFSGFGNPSRSRLSVRREDIFHYTQNFISAANIK